MTCPVRYSLTSSCMASSSKGAPRTHSELIIGWSRELRTGAVIGSPRRSRDPGTCTAVQLQSGHFKSGCMASGVTMVPGAPGNFCLGPPWCAYSACHGGNSDFGGELRQRGLGGRGGAPVKFCIIRPRRTHLRLSEIAKQIEIKDPKCSKFT